MSDIAEFLTARLDEDEAAAKAAGVGSHDTWHTIEWYDGQFEGGLTVSVDVHGLAGAPITSRGALLRVDGEHIARHDPARVLAEVAAKRAIIAEHKHVPATDPSTHNFGCEICAYDRGDCVQYGWGWCNTVRLLAAPYADHPDYNPVWRVE